MSPLPDIQTEKVRFTSLKFFIEVLNTSDIFIWRKKLRNHNHFRYTFFVGVLLRPQMEKVQSRMMFQCHFAPIRLSDLFSSGCLSDFSHLFNHLILNDNLSLVFHKNAQLSTVPNDLISISLTRSSNATHSDLPTRFSLRRCQLSAVCLSEKN